MKESSRIIPYKGPCIQICQWYILTKGELCATCQQHLCYQNPGTPETATNQKVFVSVGVGSKLIFNDEHRHKKSKNKLSPVPKLLHVWNIYLHEWLKFI